MDNLKESHDRAHAFLDAAHDLHSRYPVCDGHNDIAWCIREMVEPSPVGINNLDLNVNYKGVLINGPSHRCLHTDIPRLRQGGIGFQFWSVYTPSHAVGPIAVQTTLEQIDIVRRMVAKYPETFEMAKSVADVKRIMASGKIASCCGIEGGHQINNSLACLRMFYDLGCRYMTLTHNGGPPWADAAMSVTGEHLAEAPLGGLTKFGCEVVKEMNRLGMLVDISHVHHVTMKRALEVSLAPVIFSHSSSRALCNHPRDVPDDILEMLKVNGGVIMITFVSDFIAGLFWVRGGKVGATVLEVADHIDHVKRVIGIDHIGIGGDYDGCSKLPRGLEDVSCYPNLTAELLYRGYSEEDVGKILCGNILRVMEAAESVRDAMAAEGILPSEATI